MKTEPTKQKSLGETRVDEVLSNKPPALHPSDSVELAGERMREMNADEWPVGEEKKLLGVMDKANPDRTAARYGHDPKQTSVGKTMSRDVAFCYEDQNCAEALAIMDERHVQYLPVVDRDQRIAGIVCREELLARCTAAGARRDEAEE